MLQIVQGDIFEAGFELCGVDPTGIEKVVFSSKDLSLTENAEPFGEGYTVRIPGARTAGMPPGFSFYDLTIIFIDGQKLTALRNEVVEVLKKENHADG